MTVIQLVYTEPYVMHSATVHIIRILFDAKIRIIRIRKMASQYVKIRWTNKYCKLVNVIVSCFQVHGGKANRGL